MTVAPDEVRNQLGRLLASDGFASSARLSGFLRYVVERTLSGEADQLKEYAIGVDVFERGERYDPRLDSLVRVEAGRLRAKLAEYYGGPGAADPVIIRMPRGSYAPVFEKRAGPSPESAGAESSCAAPSGRPRLRRSSVAAAALAVVALASVLVAWRQGVFAESRDPGRPVVIAVLPFVYHSRSAGDALLAARLTDGVTSELARNGALGVVSHTSALQFAGARRPLKEIARALDADVVLEGTLIVEGDRARISARLVDGRRDRKLWVEDFAGSAIEPSELQRQIAASVVAAVKSRLSSR